MSKKKKTNKKTSKKKEKDKVVKVTSKVDKSQQIFVAMELEDDRLIGQELLGQEVTTLVYSYEEEDGSVGHRLSYAGVREACRLINRDRKSGHTIQIAERPPIIDRDVTLNGQPGVEVQIYAVDIEAGGGSWGIKFEPWQKYIGDGKGSTDFNRFALETALSKAQRNAMFNLLPAHLIEKMAQKFVKEGKSVKKIEGKKIETRVQKPQKTGDEKIYRATLDRIGKVKGDTKKLRETLKKVDNMPITVRQRARVRAKINRYLKK